MPSLFRSTADPDLPRPTSGAAVLAALLPLLLLPAIAVAGALSGVLPVHPWLLAAPQWLWPMLVLMALLLALVASLLPRERHILFLSALLGLWVLRASILDWGEQGGSAGRAELLGLSLLPWMSLCYFQFLSRTGHWKISWLDALLVAQAVAVPVSQLLTPTPHMRLLSQAWTLLLALQALAGGFWFRRQRLRSTLLALGAEAVSDDSRLISRAINLLLLLGMVALAQAGLAFHPLAPLGRAIVATIVPLLLLGMSVLVLVHLAQVRQALELQLLELEQSSQAAVAEAERRHSELAEQKLEQVTERERKRIAADLHDDLGAKLLTIVHTSESDRISTLAREALEEMRLSVRGLTGRPVHLIDALGDWRAEVVSRLGQANILAEWKSPSEEVSHTLPARAYVQTTRILREAVSNIIKHSSATHCTVSCSVLDGDFVVVIQDNGQGISAEQDGRLDKGHGMASMKARAKQMHGQCLVESGPGWGTVIRLTIPL